LLDVRNALVTIDAAGTRTEIAEKIVDKGGDYLLALKGNQPTACLRLPARAAPCRAAQQQTDQPRKIHEKARRALRRLRGKM
jgi:hypothetical protein